MDTASDPEKAAPLAGGRSSGGGSGPATSIASATAAISAGAPVPGPSTGAGGSDPRVARGADRRRVDLPVFGRPCRAPGRLVPTPRSDAPGRSPPAAGSCFFWGDAPSIRRGPGRRSACVRVAPREPPAGADASAAGGSESAAEVTPVVDPVRVDVQLDSSVHAPPRAAGLRWAGSSRPSSGRGSRTGRGALRCRADDEGELDGAGTRHLDGHVQALAERARGQGVAARGKGVETGDTVLDRAPLCRPDFACRSRRTSPRCRRGPAALARRRRGARDPDHDGG